MAPRFDIRALRKRLGWTQDKLAERLSMSRSNVSHLEKGDWEPRPATLKTLQQIENEVRLGLLVQEVSGEGSENG